MMGSCNMRKHSIASEVVPIKERLPGTPTDPPETRCILDLSSLSPQHRARWGAPTWQRICSPSQTCAESWECQSAYFLLLWAKGLKSRLRGVFNKLSTLCGLTLNSERQSTPSNVPRATREQSISLVVSFTCRARRQSQVLAWRNGNSFFSLRPL